MICKELDSFIPQNSWEKNGRTAEETVAFYLKRNFHESANVHVINGLRFLATDGSYAQIDHLVLTCYFAVIIESKSVTSAVKYESDGQWLRLWDNHWTGMPSPVQQAKNQGVALRQILQKNCEQLRKKYMFGFRQGGFQGMPVYPFVAISDSGRFIAPRENKYDNVMKADMVTDKIIKLFKEAEKANAKLTGEPIWSMPDTDLQKTATFLIEAHEPLRMVSPAAPVPASEPSPAPPVVSPAPSPAPVVPKSEKPKAREPKKIHSLRECLDCKGEISIRWGEKYKNYYWHCKACGKNVSINDVCPHCGEKLRIRKRGKEYHIYCTPCKLEALYFTDNGEV